MHNIFIIRKLKKTIIQCVNVENPVEMLGNRSG